MYMKKKLKTFFYCSNCGYESLKWLGKCPDCSAWNSFQEESRSLLKLDMGSLGEKDGKAQVMKDIQIHPHMRITSGFAEVDRVLGGGFIPGSLILLSGEPGIGKSTLVLQIAQNLGRHHRILYTSGEESKEQIKFRSNRIGISEEQVLVAAESNFENLLRLIDQESPEFLVVDSIQTMYSDQVESPPGTSSQAREISARLLALAKSRGLTIIVIGHITKDGNIAGPKMLEHLVDAVLYFEGERHYQYRTLRSFKNRFGSAAEIGIFEMGEEGLREVADPSGYLLQERALAAPGSLITAIYEGSRSLLLEVQALVSESHYNQGRRVATGYDYNRVNMIIAVLEKRIGLPLAGFDVYANIAGGIKVSEPAIDLAVAMAILSSHRNQAPDSTIAVVGEIGLTGEVRSVANLESRIKEAEKMGFTCMVIPANNQLQYQSRSMKLLPVKNIGEAIRHLFE